MLSSILKLWRHLSCSSFNYKSLILCIHRVASLSKVCSFQHLFSATATSGFICSTECFVTIVLRVIILLSTPCFGEHFQALWTYNYISPKCDLIFTIQVIPKVDTLLRKVKVYVDFVFCLHSWVMRGMGRVDHSSIFKAIESENYAASLSKACTQ